MSRSGICQKWVHNSLMLKELRVQGEFWVPLGVWFFWRGLSPMTYKLCDGYHVFSLTNVTKLLFKNYGKI